MKLFANAIKYLLLLGVSVFLMAYALRGIDFVSVKAELAQVNYFWIWLTILVSVVGYASRAYRWRMQFQPLGYKPTFWQTYHALMVGYLANTVLPRAGEVIRCTTLKKSADIPVNVSLGSVITERVIDLLLLLSCIGLTLLVEFDRLSQFFLELFSTKYEGLQQNLQTLYILAGVAIVGLGVGSWYLYKNIDQLRQHIYFQKASTFILGIVQGIFSIGKMEQKGAFIFHSIFIWVTYFLTSYLAFFSVPGTSHLTWQAGMAILVVGGLGMSAPVQGGIGVYHLLVRSTLLLYAIPLHTGMAFALLVHTSQAVLVVLMGVISLVASLLSKKNVEVVAARQHA